MGSTALDLLRTKFYRPSVCADFVRRPRLTSLLDQGRDLPLTLISAPAGSGKTSLLSDWLAACPCPSAWLSLDEGDSDLAVFLDYFIAALRTAQADPPVGDCAGVSGRPAARLTERQRCTTYGGR